VVVLPKDVFLLLPQYHSSLIQLSAMESVHVQTPQNVGEEMAAAVGLTQPHQPAQIV
jgi:hypothetical protein